MDESKRKEHRVKQAGPGALKRKARASKKSGAPTEAERKKNPKVRGRFDVGIDVCAAAFPILRLSTPSPHSTSHP